MASISIKTIRNRQYRYLQWYEGGSRVPKSQYLGPVNPKRKRRGGLLSGLTIPTALMGSLLVAGLAAKGRLGKPGGRAYTNKSPDPLQRATQIAHKAVEAIDRHYAIDKTDAESFNASRARLPPEMQQEYQRAQMNVWRGVGAERERLQPALPVSPDMKAFSERVADVQREQGEKAKGEATAADEGDGAN
jgi:hypothetical protein